MRLMKLFILSLVIKYVSLVYPERGQNSTSAIPSVNVRISFGVSDTMEKYPFVVLLALKPNLDSAIRVEECSGNALSENWVLTAAHCLQPDPPEIVTRYTNYSLYASVNPASNNIYSIVLNTFPHPKYIEVPLERLNDIGLVKMSKFPAVKYGVLLPTPSYLLMHSEVEYAGFGITNRWRKFKKKNNESVMYKREQKIPTRVLQIGFGVIVKCPEGYQKLDDEVYYEVDEFDRKILRRRVQPEVCVAPMQHESSERLQTTRAGDSGGPLIVNGKIAGVIIGHNRPSSPISSFTPVDEYLSWMKNIAPNIVIASPEAETLLEVNFSMDMSFERRFRSQHLPITHLPKD